LTTFDFLILYTEVTIAFVAFSTIVVTLRLAFGAKLSAIQEHLFRWFVESSFIAVFLGMLPVALNPIVGGGADLWQIDMYAVVLVVVVYFPVYLRRRLKTGDRVPMISRFVIAGYGVAIVCMLAVITGLLWSPSAAIITAFLLWALASNMVLFVYFLKTFIGREH
jgi:hypothetical protein